MKRDALLRECLVANAMAARDVARTCWPLSLCWVCLCRSRLLWYVASGCHDPAGAHSRLICCITKYCWSNLLPWLVLAAIIRPVWSSSCAEWRSPPGPALGTRGLQAIFALPFVPLLVSRGRRELGFWLQVFAGGALHELLALRA